MNLSCLFKHSRKWHRGATDAHGITPKLCDDCLQPIGTLLSGEVIGDQLPQQVAGTPTGRAVKQAGPKVAQFGKFQRASER